MNIQSINVQSLIKPVRVNQPSFGKRKPNYNREAMDEFSRSPQIGSNSSENVYYYRFNPNNNERVMIGDNVITSDGSTLYIKKGILKIPYTGWRYEYRPEDELTIETYYKKGKPQAQELMYDGHNIRLTEGKKGKGEFHNIILEPTRDERAGYEYEEQPITGVGDREYMGFDCRSIRPAGNEKQTTLSREEKNGRITTTFSFEEDNKTITLKFNAEKERQGAESPDGFYVLEITDNETKETKQCTLEWRSNENWFSCRNDDIIDVESQRHYLEKLQNTMDSPEHILDFWYDSTTHDQLDHVIGLLGKKSDN